MFNTVKRVDENNYCTTLVYYMMISRDNEHDAYPMKTD
jgi:hypothetical protein